eukprot:TRINITY_DN13137_c0_g1_i1.p1 TRINITY_DN13137_c0_g1~~TRINITY_DN13137_c0_g1_i1.p1  ORF type:complete len:115 (-),score=31.96 TRINITY_DN13137_c0_g1_i1:21-365(-)
MVDKDGSGQIEFEEFLLIIKSVGDAKDQADSNGSPLRFFKDLIEGKLADGKISNVLSLDVIFGSMRRMKFLEYLEAGGKRDTGDAEKILKAYGRLLYERQGKEVPDFFKAQNTT